MVVLLVCSLRAAAAQPVFQGKAVQIYTRPAAPRNVDAATASIVTMHFADAPLKLVLAEFGRQTDASVTVSASNDGYAQVPSLDWLETARVSVDLRKASYWDALPALLKAIPVALDPQPREGELLLVEHVQPGTGPDRFAALLAAPGARRVGPLLLAPLVASRTYGNTPETRLTLNVLAEPRVAGFTGLAVLRLTALRAAGGASLLGEQREWSTTEEHRWSNEHARWVFDLGDPLTAPVSTLRGELLLAVAAAAPPRFLDLNPMFKPAPPVPGEVQVDDHCQIFRLPDFNTPRGTQVSRDRLFPAECRREGIHHTIPRPNRAGYNEEFTLVLHNVTKEPETFVVWTTYPPGVADYTSNPKPALVQGHGEYRVLVAPDETERLHVGYTVDQTRGRPEAAVADVTLAPRARWRTDTVGEVSLAVKSVVPQAGEYVVRGAWSSAATGLVRFACPNECQALDVRDAVGRQILRQAVFGPVTRVGNRDVMEWSLTTGGRGLVPAKLFWSVESAKWVHVPLP